MGAAALQHGVPSSISVPYVLHCPLQVTVQYCMTLPRELLQSVQLSAVRRARVLHTLKPTVLCNLGQVSGDYISKDNWRIGLTSLLATSLGLAPFKNVFWSS